MKNVHLWWQLPLESHRNMSPWWSGWVSRQASVGELFFKQYQAYLSKYSSTSWCFRSRSTQVPQITMYIAYGFYQRKSFWPEKSSPEVSEYHFDPTLLNFVIVNVEQVRIWHKLCWILSIYRLLSNQILRLVTCMSLKSTTDKVMNKIDSYE